jgi:hypothetical protein
VERMRSMWPLGRRNMFDWNGGFVNRRPWAVFASRVSVALLDNRVGLARSTTCKR